ncbi:MAG: recombinase family protein [Oscillospiraceae bacterium]|nr:recombinase family protein [Oscillospiraceae bacterium]
MDRTIEQGDRPEPQNGAERKERFVPQVRQSPKVAFYLRLSRADGEGRESDSIENQRKLLEEFHSRTQSLGGDPKLPYSHATYDLPHLEYVDDGYSGGTFRRPGFCRLIEDCKRGKVSVILVKDLSRLGRDMIEVGEYLEEIFPFLGVRFISVTEHYDSGGECMGALPFDLSVSNILNDYYLTDLAQKSRAGRVSKWKRGELTSVQTPLGYVCRDVNEGWRIDPEGAAIVRSIFDEALRGRDAGRIAAHLNYGGVPTPYLYLKGAGLWNGRSYAVTADEKKVWSAGMVRRILRDPSYTGRLTQGKRVPVILGKGVSRRAREDETFQHENRHDAIVTQEEFRRAQAVIRFQPSSAVRNARDYPLKGVVRCGSCGRRMEYRSGTGGNSFVCPTRAQGAYTGCGAGSFDEKQVESAVLAALRQMGAECERVMEAVIRCNQLELDVAATQREIDALRERQITEYEAYIQGALSQAGFAQLQAEVKQRLDVLQGQLLAAEERERHVEEIVETLQPIADAGELVCGGGCLTQPMVKTLIRAVYLHNNGEIEVIFREEEKIFAMQKEFERNSNMF